MSRSRFIRKRQVYEDIVFEGELSPPKPRPADPVFVSLGLPILRQEAAGCWLIARPTFRGGDGLHDR